MIIKVYNNLDSHSQYSFTSTNVTAGGTVVPVKNINSFTASHAIQIGKTGEEQTQILVLGTGSPSGTALNTIGTIVYDANIDTPVYDINYNQIVFKRSTTGTAGTAVALSDGTISITPDSPYTEFDDTTGATTYAYKTRFRNSVTGAESSDSDWFTPSGPSFYSLVSMRTRIKDRIYNAGYIKSDDVINDWINEWLEEMNTAAVKVNKDYLLGTTTIAFGTSGVGTVTASDFMYPRKIEVTYDGITWTKTTKIEVNRFDDQDIFSSLNPRHYWEGDTKIGFLPNGQAGTARMVYSKGETVLSNDTDELPFPMRRYSRSFVNYGLSCAYENDEKETLSATNYTKAKTIKGDFINEISPRDNTGPSYIEMTDSLSGSDELVDDEYLA